MFLLSHHKGLCMEDKFPSGSNVREVKVLPVLSLLAELQRRAQLCCMTMKIVTVRRLLLLDTPPAPTASECDYSEQVKRAYGN